MKDNPDGFLSHFLSLRIPPLSTFFFDSLRRRGDSSPLRLFCIIARSLPERVIARSDAAIRAYRYGTLYRNMADVPYLRRTDCHACWRRLAMTWMRICCGAHGHERRFAPLRKEMDGSFLLRARARRAGVLPSNSTIFRVKIVRNTEFSNPGAFAAFYPFFAFFAVDYFFPIAYTDSINGQNAQNTGGNRI